MMKLKFLVQQFTNKLMKKNKYFYLLFFLFINLFFLPVKSDPIFEMGKTIFLIRILEIFNFKKRNY